MSAFKRRKSPSVSSLFIEDVGLDLFPDLIPKKTRYAMTCPAHLDTHPSFFLIPDWNKYYCFGCGYAGGPLDLVQEFSSSPIDYLKQKVAYNPLTDAQLLIDSLAKEYGQKHLRCENHNHRTALEKFGLIEPDTSPLYRSDGSCWYELQDGVKRKLNDEEVEAICAR